MVLLKPANRIRRPQDRLANPLLVKRHERAIAFLHFNDAVLDRHTVAIPVAPKYNIVSPRSTITLTSARPRSSRSTNSLPPAMGDPGRSPPGWLDCGTHFAQDKVS